METLDKLQTKYAGRKLGKYQILSFLGKGEYGIVYKGTNTDVPGSEVAVKIFLKKDLVGEDGQPNLRRKLFDFEVEVYRMLRHPNIIKILAKIETDNTFYIVMPFCKQGDLENWIAKNGALSEKDAANAIYQITQAMACMRRHRIVHRDIKAENIFVSGDKYILGDFGMSSYDYDTGQSGGNFLSMAPELREENYQHREYSTIDIYSLGVTLYYMLFKSYPWEPDLVFFNQHKDRLGQNLPFPPKHRISDSLKRLLCSMVEVQDKRISWVEYFMAVDQLYNHLWCANTQMANGALVISDTPFLNGLSGSGSGKSNQNLSLSAELEALKRTDDHPAPESADIFDNYAKMTMEIENHQRGRSTNGQNVLATFAFWSRYKESTLAQLQQQLAACEALKAASQNRLAEVALLCLSLMALVEAAKHHERVMKGDQTLTQAPDFSAMAVGSGVYHVEDVILTAGIYQFAAEKVFQEQHGEVLLPGVHRILQQKDKLPPEIFMVMKNMCQTVLTRPDGVPGALEKAVKDIQKAFLSISPN